jgi:hypothetical protein
MARAGVPLVPAVIVGDRAVHGWNPRGYAELLGVAYEPGERLAPAELAARLDRILAATEALLRAVPDERIEWRPPERNRTLRNLGHHVFRLSVAFADGVDRGEFPQGWLQETAPPELRTGGDVARYGALVRARLQGWFAGAGADEYARVVQVYYGPQTGHELLERTTWHAAQHLRQLYDLAGRLGLRPPAPLPADALRGLPLPTAVW